MKIASPYMRYRIEELKEDPRIKGLADYFGVSAEDVIAELVEKSEKEVEALDEETKEYLLENEIDHSIDYGLQIGEVFRKPYDPKKVQNLSEKYNLDADKLGWEIEILRMRNATCELRRARQFTLKETQRYLTTLRNQAHSLSEKLLDMPLDMQKILGSKISIQTLWSLAGKLEVLVDSIDSFDDASMSLSKVPETGIRDDAILRIADIWKRLTGRKATYTTNPYNDNKRVGDFVGFLTSIAEIIGLDPKPLPERFKTLKKQIKGL